MTNQDSNQENLKFEIEDSSRIIPLHRSKKINVKVYRMTNQPDPVKNIKGLDIPELLLVERDSIEFEAILPPCKSR